MKKRGMCRRCAWAGCDRTLAKGASRRAMYCSASCRTLACRQRKRDWLDGSRTADGVVRRTRSVSSPEADVRVDGQRSVNRSVNSAMSVPSLTEQQTERRAEQVDSLVQALRDLTDGQRATMTAIDGVRQLVEQAMHDQAQQPLDDTLGLLKQTLQRLLPTTLPNAAPVDEWPTEPVQSRGYWKHWLVPVIAPTLSTVMQRLYPSTSEEASTLTSSLLPVAVIAAQLYLAVLLQKPQPPLPTVNELCGWVASSLRALPMFYPSDYVESLLQQKEQVKIAVAISIATIRQRIQSSSTTSSTLKA